MNKSLLTGLVAGIAVATAGGVAGYAFLSEPSVETGSAAVIDDAVDEADAAAAARAEPAPAQPVAAAPAPAQPAARAPAPAPAPAPRTQPVAAAAPAPAPASVAQEECWEEEVTVQAEPRDERAIAGTATGAILGGALAKKLGDDNDLATAAGAAAGAFAGRRIQRRIQENNTTTTTEVRCAPVGSR